MSRETDSSSSGPNGRGGAAYPSGTPPYGTPAASENGADEGRSAAGTPPEERRTETTLTTRIRINIPGSRPIPPVVVRTPVGDADASAEGTDGGGAEPAGVAGGASPPAPAASAADPAAPAGEKQNNWFAPRKSSAPTGGQGGGSTNGAGLQGSSGAPAPSGPSAPTGPGGPSPFSGPSGGSGRQGAQGAPGGARPSAANGAGPRPGGGPVGSGPRPGGGTNGAGLPGATGAGPVAPGHGGGTGSFDVSAALTGSTGSFPLPGSDAAGEPRRDDLPYFSEGTGRGPAGPTGGPVTGDGPLVPPAGPGVRPGSLAAGPGRPGGPGMGQGGPGGPGGPGGQGGQGGPGAGYPGPGGHSGLGGPGGGLSDDTAILTPQKPAPEPGGQGYGAPGDNVSGHTLTSGIPVVPATQNSPFGPGAHTDGPLPHTPPKLPDPVTPPAASSAKPAAKKKGRSKLMLLVVGVVVIGGGAYGAGLLMNHSDVPKGTTVLGVDIGGGTRDEAVKKLDDAFGDRTNKALKLSVDGDTVSLKPDQSGLQLDSKATVSAAATSDYNPVSVIGSLFGQQRVIDPVMPVDEEKLQAALERAAGGSGSAADGTIKFQSGKAVAVYGKAGKGIDVAPSMTAVEEAYRTQVETNTTTPVKVATKTRQPTIPNAEVDRMLKKFAEPAMSGLVTVRTDATHFVLFSPEKSIYKFLSVQAVDGKLVEHYDLAVLKELYGGAFDGVTITKGNGSKKPVSPEDVAVALGTALRGTTPAARIVTIPTNPS
ncbi:hypothetical protein [Streptomyces sp. SAS_270]|uniref:hypothetical protein n=1 Tax=Streptomyces sp. SAS_270 TaxID=3412748 RepID=UPI00403CF313